MHLIAFSVHDLAVGAFLPPFFMRSKGEAIRAFLDTVRDPKSPFGQHPKDFVLMSLALWDDSDGGFTLPSIGGPSPVMSGLEAVAFLKSAPPEA